MAQNRFSTSVCEERYMSICLDVVHFSLLFSKCKLEMELYGVEPALQTCRTMLLLWKSLYEVATDW